MLPPPKLPGFSHADPVTDDLRLVHAHMEKRLREREVETLRRWFDDSPVMSVCWWCSTVPKSSFTDEHHLDAWIRLLKECIDRYVSMLYSRKPKKTGWRAKVLRGIFRHLSRSSKTFSDTRHEWDQFVNAVFQEAKLKPSINPLTKKLFSPPKGNQQATKRHYDNFKKLGIFLGDPNQKLWPASQEFVMPMIRGLEHGTLQRLLSGSKYEKVIAEEAIRSDLRAQQVEYSSEMHRSVPARDALRRLILDLELFDLAERADVEIGPLIPYHQSFVFLLRDEERDRKKLVRTPNAKRRYSRRSKM